MQVQRLAEAAALDGITPEVGLLLGEALHELGRFEEAERRAGKPQRRRRRTTTTCSCPSWSCTPATSCGACRCPTRPSVTTARSARLRGHPAGDELTLNEAMLLTYSGRPLEILRVLDRGSGGDRTAHPRALRAHAELPALVAIGRCETAADGRGAGVRGAARCPEQIAIPTPEVHLLTRMYALGGDRPSRRCRAPSPPLHTRPRRPLLHPTRSCGSRSSEEDRALLTGQVETACRWLGEAAARCETHALQGPRRLVLSELAAAAACAGDEERPRARPRKQRRSRRSASHCPSSTSAPGGHASPPAICPVLGPCSRKRPSSLARPATDRRRRGFCTTSPVSATRAASSTASASSRRSVKATSCLRTRRTPKRSSPGAPAG